MDSVQASKEVAPQVIPSATSTEERGFPPVGDVRARTLEILSITDEIERIRKFSTFLRDSTTRDCQEARAALLILAKEGRGHFYYEAELLTRQIGRLGGREALEDLLKSGDPPSVHGEVLQGWASADPEGAAQWVAAPGRKQRDALLSWLALGTLEKDPQKAIQLLYDQPLKVWEQNMGSILARIIQQRGFAAADELYSYMRSDATAPAEGKTRFLSELSFRRAAMGLLQQDAPGMLAWVDRHFPVGTPHGDWLVTDAATRVDPMQTIGWVDMRAERMNPEQSAAVYAGIAQAWVANGKGFQDWINANPTHPQRDVMLGRAASVLTQMSKLAEANDMAARISDPTRRGEAQRAIDEAGAAKATPQ